MGNIFYIRKKNGSLFYGPKVTTINNFLGSENSNSTSEVILSSLLIPASSFTTSDIFTVDARMRKSGTTGTMTTRIRIGTTQTTADAQVGIFATLTNNIFVPISRDIKVTSSNGTSEVFSGTTSASLDGAYSGVTLSNISINWDVDNYISVTGQLSSASDVMNCMNIYIRQYK